MRTVLFGLDGATYTILDHLIAEGVMPHLGGLYGRAARATLLSTPVPITPQAWTSMATGRSAGHHGLHDFVRVEKKAGGESVFFRLTDSRDNHCETIWKYASRHGRQVTVLNYIGTAPPEPIDGHVMPGFISGRHLRRLSYPADLFARLQAAGEFDVKVLGLDYDVEQEVLGDMKADRWLPWIRHHIEREQAWFGVLEHLMTHEPSDLTAIVLDGVDKIQHLAYRFLDPDLMPAVPTPWEAEIISLCREYFKQVDDFLGRTIAMLGTGGRLVVASDHGFTASREIVYINKILFDEGFLCWRDEDLQGQGDASISRRTTQVADAIDLANTRAYALSPSCNGIYLNVPPERYEADREDLIRRLLQFRDSEGLPVVVDVRRREEWFPGPFMERLPDLTLVLRGHGFLSVLNSDVPVRRRQELAGTHHPDGVLLATGPGIAEGAEVGRLDILDVAPLLMHSLGLEIPRDLEGSFPSSLFKPSFLECHPPVVATPEHPGHGQAHPADLAVDEVEEPYPDEDEREVVMTRLRSLGYIE